MNLTTIAVALLLSGGLLASPASADPGLDASGSRPDVTPSSRCVTKSEYYSLERFETTRAEAESILDWDGFSASKRPGVNTWKVRRYRGCDGHQNADGYWRTSKILIWYGNHNRVQDAAWIISEWVPDPN